MITVDRYLLNLKHSKSDERSQPLDRNLSPAVHVELVLPGTVTDSRRDLQPAEVLQHFAQSQWYVPHFFCFRKNNLLLAFICVKNCNGPFGTFLRQHSRAIWHVAQPEYRPNGVLAVSTVEWCGFCLMIGYYCKN